MSEWQPIETAPKDGTAILLYGDAWNDALRYGIGIWVKDSFREKTLVEETEHRQVFVYEDVDCSSWKYEGSFGPPTHWMPLPDPPK